MAIVDEKGRPYRRIVRRGTSVKAKKVAEVYELAHLAWRVGAIESFYYGQASPSDPRVVWMVDGHEWEADTAGRAAAKIAIEAALDGRQIADITFGDAWCGYRSVVVTFADGGRVREHYNGWETVTEAC